MQIDAIYSSAVELVLITLAVSQPFFASSSSLGGGGEDVEQAFINVTLSSPIALASYTFELSLPTPDALMLDTVVSSAFDNVTIIAPDLLVGSTESSYDGVLATIQVLK